MKNNVFESPVTTWNFKKTSLDKRYIGPMAQDFYEQFQLGVPDNRKLSTGLMDAAMFASIQALANISDTLKIVDSKIQNVLDSLQIKNNTLDKRLDSVSKTVLFIKSESDSIKTIVNDSKIVSDSLKRDNLELKLRVKVLEERVIELANLIGADVDCYADIILEQNIPNPFSETTSINYYIPAKYANSQFVLADATGQREIQTFDVSYDTPIQITISTQNLDNGVYLYGIRYNGRIVKSKKMIVLK